MGGFNSSSDQDSMFGGTDRKFSNALLLRDMIEEEKQESEGSLDEFE